MTWLRRNRLGLILLPVALALAYGHTCAVVVVRGGSEAGGRVKCWGSNNNGELGLGDTFDRGDAFLTARGLLPAP